MGDQTTVHPSVPPTTQSVVSKPLSEEMKISNLFLLTVNRNREIKVKIYEIMVTAPTQAWIKDFWWKFNLKT